MMMREPAVAGLFYPGQAASLARAVDSHLGEMTAEARCPKALIVPHAGYDYSGSVAASGYRLLRGRSRQVRRVVLLGPCHHVPLKGLALPGCDSFETPLGSIPLDSEAVEQLLRLPQVQVSPLAHAKEHSLEVQLPFLQRLLDDFTLVPLVVGYTPAEAVAEVLELLWGGDETLLLISTDLSHFHPYEEAKVLDRETSERICQLRQPLGGEQACGCYALNGLLLALKRRGMAVTELDLRNSGDSGAGRDRVVGYGAYASF